MNELTIFNNPEFGTIRTVEINGEVWFVGKDVAQALGYGDTDQALRRHVDDEDKLTRNFDGSGQNRSMTIINDSGTYSLILSSRLPNAKKFKHWITSEVIPSIRKTGSYTTKAKEIAENNASKRLHIMEMNARSRAANQMTKLWSAAGIKPQYQALALNGYLDGLSLPREAFGEVCTTMLDATTIARNLHIYSKSGAPHTLAVGAVISQLSLEPNEKAETPYSRNGHDGVSVQYTASVQDKVKAWIVDHEYPQTIELNGKRFAVSYREGGATA